MVERVWIQMPKSTVEATILLLKTLSDTYHIEAREQRKSVAEELRMGAEYFNLLAEQYRHAMITSPNSDHFHFVRNGRKPRK